MMLTGTGIYKIKPLKSSEVLGGEYRGAFAWLAGFIAISHT